jgi:RimJ/RimL family protein N-acetyltransferase
MNTSRCPTKVLHAAETRGFDRFVAYLLAGNVAIRRLLKKIGDVVSTRVSGEVSEITLVRRPRSHLFHGFEARFDSSSRDLLDEARRGS